MTDNHESFNQTQYFSTNYLWTDVPDENWMSVGSTAATTTTIEDSVRYITKISLYAIVHWDYQFN